jgi:uncharacterized C2H2 Zn-finger protein
MGKGCKTFHQGAQSVVILQCPFCDRIVNSHMSYKMHIKVSHSTELVTPDVIAKMYENSTALSRAMVRSKGMVPKFNGVHQF